MALTERERDIVHGMIAQRAARMTFSTTPLFPDYVVEQVIQFDLDCVDEAETLSEAIDLAYLGNETL